MHAYTDAGMSGTDTQTHRHTDTDTDTRTHARTRARAHTHEQKFHFLRANLKSFWSSFASELYAPV